MKTKEVKVLLQPLGHEGSGAHRSGARPGSGFQKQQVPHPLRAKDEWGGVKPGRIGRLGWVTPTRKCRFRRSSLLQTQRAIRISNKDVGDKPHIPPSPPPISPGSTRQPHSRTRGRMVSAGQAGVHGGSEEFLSGPRGTLTSSRGEIERRKGREGPCGSPQPGEAPLLFPSVLTLGSRRPAPENPPSASPKPMPFQGLLTVPPAAHPRGPVCRIQGVHESGWENSTS